MEKREALVACGFSTTEARLIEMLMELGEGEGGWVRSADLVEAGLLRSEISERGIELEKMGIVERKARFNVRRGRPPMDLRLVKGALEGRAAAIGQDVVGAVAK